MNRIKVAVSCVFIAIFILAISQGVNASVVLCFDDCDVSQVQAVPILERWGYKGTFFSITGRMDANDPDSYSWAFASSLKSKNHEIGSHTVDHLQLDTITLSQADFQLSQSRQRIHDQLGFWPTSFAYPSGAGQDIPELRKLVASYYSIGRCVDPETNLFPFAPYYVTSRSVVSTDTLQDLINLITAAEQAGGIQVLNFHKLGTGTPTDQYWTDLNLFDSLLGYLKANRIKVQTLSDAMNIQTRLAKLQFPNSDLEALDASGWAASWSRSGDLTKVVLQEASGALARIFSAGHFLSLAGSAAAENKAISGEVELPADNQNHQYLLEFYTETIGGSCEIWVNELDSGGIYLGGQTLLTLSSDTVELMRCVYVPKTYTGKKVTKVSFDITAVAATTLSARLDNFSLSIIGPAKKVTMTPVYLLLLGE